MSDSPNQTAMPPCLVCGEKLVTRQSGPLPGCPQGISTVVCPKDETHNFGAPAADSQPHLAGDIEAELRSTANANFDNASVWRLMHDAADELTRLRGVERQLRDAVDEFWDDEHCDCGTVHPTMQHLRAILSAKKGAKRE
jgi:hypothetical protein